MTLTDIVFVTKNMGLEVFPFVFPFSVGRGMMAQRKETVRAQPHFVGLLTDTFSHIFAIWQRSISAFSPSHDSFSNDRFSSHTALNSVWRWCFVNTATKETAACFGIRSPRVRDSHPIPLSSIEQECVSRRSWLRCECFACPALGRAFATKALLFNLMKPMIPSLLADTIGLGQSIVTSCQSSFAVAPVFGKRRIWSFRCFLGKQNRLHGQNAYNEI